MNEDKLKAYNTTNNAVSDILTECENFTDLEWCRGYGCEFYKFCKELEG